MPFRSGALRRMSGFLVTVQNNRLAGSTWRRFIGEPYISPEKPHFLCFRFTRNHAQRGQSSNMILLNCATDGVSKNSAGAEGTAPGEAP